MVFSKIFGIDFKSGIFTVLAKSIITAQLGGITQENDVWVKNVMFYVFLPKLTVPSFKTQAGQVTAAAVCSSCHLAEKSTSKIEFVLAWDMPTVHFKNKGHSYLR